MWSMESLELEAPMVDAADTAATLAANFQVAEVLVSVLASELTDNKQAKLFFFLMMMMMMIITSKRQRDRENTSEMKTLLASE